MNRNKRFSFLSVLCSISVIRSPDHDPENNYRREPSRSSASLSLSRRRRAAASGPSIFRNSGLGHGLVYTSSALILKRGTHLLKTGSEAAAVLMVVGSMNGKQSVVSSKTLCCWCSFKRELTNFCSLQRWWWASERGKW